MKKLQTSQTRAIVGGATSWLSKFGGTVSTMPAPLVLDQGSLVSSMPTPLVLD